MPEPRCVPPPRRPHAVSAAPRFHLAVPVAAVLTLAAAILILGAAVPAPAAAQQPAPVPVGDTFTLPTFAYCAPTAEAFAPLPDDRLVGTWWNGSVRARIFERDGTPVGDEFGVGPAVPSELFPQVASHPDAGFVVAWRHRNVGTFFARRFAASGEPQTGVIELFTSPPASTLPAIDGMVLLADGSFSLLTRRLGGELELRWFDADGGSLGPAQLLDQRTPIPGGGDSVPGESGAVAQGDAVVVVWLRRFNDETLQLVDTAVLTRAFRPAGPLGPERRIDGGGPEPKFGALIDASPDGVAQATWSAVAGEDQVLLARRIGPLGAPAGPVVELPIAEAAVFSYGVAVDESGGLAVAWTEDGEVLFRLFDPSGVPVRQALGMGVDFPPPETPLVPAVLPYGGGRFDVLWRRFDPPAILPTGCEFTPETYAREIAAGCLAGVDGLCLQGGRFRVEVDWQDQHTGGSGFGRPLPQTADTGGFWFFRQGNVELLTKVLDGNPVNDHFWVFYGSLTDVGFQLTVTDTLEDRERVYPNPPGTMASAGDVTAFSPLPGSFAGEGTFIADRRAFATAAPVAVGPLSEATFPQPCPDDPEVGCLQGNRFLVEVDWTDPHNGGSGRGTVVPLNSDPEPDSTAFWFFHQDNLELAVKVLDGSAINGSFWVFYGSLTDVGFRLTVTDRTSGRLRFYDNPPLTFASRGDTDGFSGSCTCPPVIDPVCGVDGVTYGSACEAACAGVEVAHQGPCES